MKGAYNLSEFHVSIKDAFNISLTKLVTAAKKKNKDFELEIRDNSPNSWYLSQGIKFLKNSKNTVIITGSLPEDTYSPLIEELSTKLIKHPDSSVYIYVGHLRKGTDNKNVQFLKKNEGEYKGKLRLTVLNICPTIHGIFTDSGGICQDLHTHKDIFRKNYIFNGVNMLKNVESYIKQYKVYKKR